MESDANPTDAMEDISEDLCDDNCLNQLWVFWIEGVNVPAIALFGIIGMAYKVLTSVKCEIRKKGSGMSATISLY